jgi:glycine/D-amino acid oxidase-like deaminating enzyme
MRVVVVGGGIAGLTAAWGLARAGVRDLVLLEREDQLFAHSSGRNAAIYRPVETQPPVTRLALRTAELYDEILGDRREWLKEDGVLLTASTESALARLAKNAEDAGIAIRWMDHDELVATVPAVDGGHARAALAVDSGGVLDLHAIATTLGRVIRDAGGRIEVSRPAARLIVRGGDAIGVELGDGQTLSADVVVVAGGAWASELGESAGAPLPLTPVRRHLVMLEPEAPLPPDTPTVWDGELEAYFRPESGAVLASPGDATPWRPEVPAADPAALELLAQKLGKMAPALAGSRVRRSWACLRTFAADKVSVVGADPRVRGLFWLAGLGGHGITAGAAAGEVLAASVLDREHVERDVLSPARLL